MSTESLSQSTHDTCNEADPLSSEASSHPNSLLSPLGASVSNFLGKSATLLWLITFAIMLAYLYYFSILPFSAFILGVIQATPTVVFSSVVVSIRRVFQKPQPTPEHHTACVIPHGFYSLCTWMICSLFATEDITLALFYFRPVFILASTQLITGELLTIIDLIAVTCTFSGGFFLSRPGRSSSDTLLLREKCLVGFFWGVLLDLLLRVTAFRTEQLVYGSVSKRFFIYALAIVDITIAIVWDKMAPASNIQIQTMHEQMNSISLIFGAVSVLVGHEFITTYLLFHRGFVTDRRHNIHLALAFEVNHVLFNLFFFLNETILSSAAFGSGLLMLGTLLIS